jgi:DnaJ-class molecular chaperone
MKITIGESTKERMAILNIENFPFSEKELKSNFRKLLHIHHEDKGGSKNKTQQIIEAYNFLKNMVVENVSDSSKPAKDDLFDLSARCHVCNGLGSVLERQFGYFSSGEQIKKQCYKCKGTGKVEMELFNPVIPRGAVLT